MLHTHKKFWAARLGTAPVLPMTREEMDCLGWDVCDIVLVGGDAYIDHPSFSTGIVGRFFACRGLSRWGGGAAQVRRGLFGVGCAVVVLGDKFGEYGLDGEPLHGGEAASS